MYPDNYTTASGVNFTFNNIAVDADRAEDMCNEQCGHLASYTSLTEQNDVENFYISNVSRRLLVLPALLICLLMLAALVPGRAAFAHTMQVTHSTTTSAT